jgi:formate hydrogenlyase subunit 5
MTSRPTQDVAVARPAWLPKELHGAVDRRLDAEVHIAVGPGGFSTAARVLKTAGARFVTLHEALAPERSIVLVCALAGELVAVRAPVGDDGRLHHEALGGWWPAARWPELELAERRGLVPMDLGDTSFTTPDADRLDRRVEGLDAFVIPYGPIRSGIFEAIQFQIETGGEDVPRLQTRPFFKHRGMQERFRGLNPEPAVAVAERVAGIAGVAHACAFAHAVERALGVAPPPRAERWRAALAELERLANHLDVIGKEAETTALSVGHARFGILKENVMRLQAALTGSRFGRGVVVPGGVRQDGRVDLDVLLEALGAFEGELRRDRRLFLRTGSMTDRLIGSGRLDRALVEAYAAVGPVARGSGVSTDARHERPYGDYRRLGTEVATARDGDAMARIEVRFAELRESIRLLRQSVDHLRRRNGDLREPLATGSGSAYGWVESPQGELVTWVEIENGVVTNVHIASPSLRNWALFDHAFPGDVLTDFAFIEHSFGLTPAGADR